MPIDIVVKKDGRIGFEFDSDSLFVIGEVSRYTGYNTRTLQRLEAEGTIPGSTRDESGRRVWRAVDIVKIRSHRNKTMRGQTGK